VKFVTFLTENSAKQESDLILSTYELSKHGLFSLKDGLKLALDKNIKVILEWDILVTEDEFSLIDEVFSTLDFSQISAIRVQDVGALQYVLTKTELPIQLILESGNRNLIGIKKWISLVGNRLERIILSPELDMNELEEIKKEVSVPVEILIFGKILLFYSPRKLLTPQFGEREEEVLKVQGKSEESPHRGFSLHENRHGTLMYNPKDLNLFSYLNEIEQMGIEYCRIDNRDFSSELSHYFNSNDFEALIEHYPKTLIKGFFHKNKTDVLFKKLKNQKLLIKDQSYVGNIVNVIKNKQIAIQLANKTRALIPGDELVLLTPEGKRKEFTVSEIQNISGTPVEKTTDEELVLIPYPANLSIKTAVYWKDSFKD
jgi:putative protease